MSVLTSAPSYVAGQILSAAMLNALQDGLQAPWTPYAVSWAGSTTNPTLGNGTLAGGYLQLGKTILGAAVVTIGSTTALGSGYYSWTLPFAMLTYPKLLGVGLVSNNSGTLDGRIVAPVTSSQIVLVDTAGSRVSGSSPFALTSGMQIELGFVYESA